MGKFSYRQERVGLEAEMPGEKWVGKWVKVKDRRPPCDGPYVCMGRDKSTSMRIYSSLTREFEGSWDSLPEVVWWLEREPLQDIPLEVAP